MTDNNRASKLVEDLASFETSLEKFYKPELVANSVVSRESADVGLNPAAPIIFQVAHIADEIVPWGRAVKRRDKELRSFWVTEPILASAVYTMATSIAALDWEIIPSDPARSSQKNTIKATEKMLNSAGGVGWRRTLMLLLVDIYTQDNGGFLEIVRAEDSPTSPVIGIQHLDSARCYRTGDPEYPVLYFDAKGVYHKMPWYTIVSFEDMMSPVDSMFGVGYCAVTRCLRSAQLLRDIGIYKREKIAGHNPGAISFISGMSQREIENIRVQAEEMQKNRTAFRYNAPLILGTINPEANLKKVEVLMASLPDGYDEDATMKWYITLIASAFGTDYQQFAPLTGGSLGSGQQSEVLHMKSRGKGPALLIKFIEDTLNNYGIVPSTVQFQFKSDDDSASEDKANARYLRGRDLSLRVSSGILSREAALLLAVEDGDIPEWIADLVMTEIENEPEEISQQTNNDLIEEPDPTTSDQIEGGMESDEQMERGKGIDDVRAEMIRRLQRRDELAKPEFGVELTEEDVTAVQEEVMSRFDIGKSWFQKLLGR